MEQTIQLQEDDTMLKLLLELAETNIEYLLPQLKRVLDMMVKVGRWSLVMRYHKMLQWQLAGDEATGDSWRQLGLEMVTWLAKNGKRTKICHHKLLCTQQVCVVDVAHVLLKSH